LGRAERGGGQTASVRRRRGGEEDIPRLAAAGAGLVSVDGSLKVSVVLEAIKSGEGGAKEVGRRRRTNSEHLGRSLVRS
jgi:hypothetical protein